MTNCKEGGPAFPRPIGEVGLNGYYSWNKAQDGMTLRDYFAGQALTGLSVNFPRYADIGTSLNTLAADAYNIADAMLKVREGE